MTSTTLPIYKRWLETATPAQIAFVDEVYLACEQHYEQGGDVIVETFEPAEVLAQFKTIYGVKKFCNDHIDRAKDARWGEDSDAELKREHWQ